MKNKKIILKNIFLKYKNKQNNYSIDIMIAHVI